MFDNSAPAIHYLPLETYFRHEGEKDLLRFSTAGSVDDGKSTLIGRLLHDAGGVFDDQLDAVRNAKVNRAGEGLIDLSLLTDGLRAEREQGITIDVAYRYFATPRRKFIIADTPGHEQYTRNMITGASTCHAAVILVDASLGVQPQSRRHAYIAWLLGLHHMVVAVNKMDLLDYSEAGFRKVAEDFQTAVAGFGGITPILIPVSALQGDNVVTRSERMPWYQGPTLLELLEELPVEQRTAPLRFPVQAVIRPDSTFRGFAGQVASGRVAVGDEVEVLPGGRQSRIKRIVTWEGDLSEAIAPMSVTLVLEDNIDISRGDLIAQASAPPHPTRRIVARVVALQPQELAAGQTYLLKCGSRRVPARIRSVNRVVDIHTFVEHPAEHLRMNEIGHVEIETTMPIFVDAYRVNRRNGAFILIDHASNNTVAAGMVDRCLTEERHSTGALTFNREPLHSIERSQRWHHPYAAIRVGPSGSFARALERAIFELGGMPLVLPAELLPPVEEYLREAGLLLLLTCEQAEVDTSSVPNAIREMVERGILPDPL